VADTTVGTLMGRLEQPIPVAPELGPLGPIVARAGRPEASERLDAMALGAALQATANDLPAPGRLPLAGIAALDETLTRLDDDPTEIGQPSTRPGAEGATGVAATQWDQARPGPGGTGTGDATVALPLSPGDVVPAPPAAQPPVAPALSKAGRRRRRWPIVAVVALVVALAGAGVAYAIAQANVPSHPVPNEVNRPEAEATAALRALKFKVAFRRPFVNGTTAGQVTDQSPDARPGRTLKEGHVVTLTVSRGPQPIPVPDLANLDRAAAEAAIAKAGFVVGDVTEIHDEKAPVGALLDFNPKTGLAPTGSKIALTVSSGPAPRVVPDLAGKSFAAASAALSDLGLEAARGDDYSDTVPAGQVIGSTPASGASVDRGATVTVVVSQGQPSVPDLKGMTVAAATARLQAAGLKVGGVYGPPGGNYVLLSVPGSGTTVKRGASISLFVL
jgi:serine/threonine-protein kinase